MFDPDEMENPAPAEGTLAAAILEEGAFALELGALRRHAARCEEAGWKPEDVKLVAQCARDSGKRKLEHVFATCQRENSYAFVLTNARAWREKQNARALAPGEGERRDYKRDLRTAIRRHMTWDEKLELARMVAGEFADTPEGLRDFASYLGESIDGARALLADADVSLHWRGQVPAGPMPWERKQKARRQVAG